MNVQEQSDSNNQTRPKQTSRVERLSGRHMQSHTSVTRPILSMQIPISGSFYVYIAFFVTVT